MTKFVHLNNFKPNTNSSMWFFPLLTVLSQFGANGSSAAESVLKGGSRFRRARCEFLLLQVRCATPPSPVYSHLPHPHPHNHPQAWPVSGSQTKFKLEQGQLLIQPLWAHVIFPCQGFFPVRGPCLCVRETESEAEEKRGQRVVERLTKGQQVWNLGGASNWGATEGLSLGLYGEKIRNVFWRTRSLNQAAVSRWRLTERRPSRSS